MVSPSGFGVLMEQTRRVEYFRVLRAEEAHGVVRQLARFAAPDAMLDHGIRWVPRVIPGPRRWQGSGRGSAGHGRSSGRVVEGERSPPVGR